MGLAAFLSTWVNKVDRKGRVSVPAAWRASLQSQSFQGVIAYPSITLAALEGFGRDTLDAMNKSRLDRNLAGGDLRAALTGNGGDDELIDTIMGLVRELPFDPEGRISLPKNFAEHAGITEEATFVGLGNRFQIWSPKAYEPHHRAALARARSQLGRGPTS
jgi:MraZ protein